ncbi:hypothetical protein NUW58_g112 [Xylaria curta]|uniref:Uncharacterized protein n=1 Tax=Xylaria curta TaxID=42375 RepID=A0ACC1PS72_9PEZI|nr:hypothetical protein NUW58_g112 [Xylaria curta]
MSPIAPRQDEAELSPTLRRELYRKPVERVTDQLEIPSLDDRQYRVVRLPNDLEALLVHDPETDKASAALDVNVGNFSDEDTMPGMAHAVEHLLFMGTKKYPEENAYNVYLSSHSGSSNAYTGATSTNYYFDISAKPSNGEEPSETNLSPLHGGLDRFAQFFIEPLFLPSTLDRELRAVDSENKKNLQSDQWRLHQLEKSQSNPKHPYCHFSTGNLEVLKTIPEAQNIDVRQKFIDFYEKHYSANRMKLCVLGRESLDMLETWVADLFSGVPNKNLPQNRWKDEVPFNKDNLAMQCFAKPVMDSRELNLFFPFLDEEKLYESQPSRYISHLIGHEGPGSIMAYIKARGWANSLSAGAYNVCPGTPGIFDCQVRLTKEGLKNYKEVAKVFFQYISLLRQTPPQEWIFNEQKEMADVEFKFKQKTPASRFTSKISSTFQEIGIKQKNGTAPNTNQKKIPDDFLAELSEALETPLGEQPSSLHLPHKNQFIPTKLEVEKKEVEKPATAPRVIRNDNVARTWWKKDDTFWVPKASLIVSMKNPIVFASAKNSVKTRLFTDLVRDALEEYSYDAELAGLQYNVTLDSRGLFVEVSGYNDKLAVLLEQVLITMRDLVIKEDRFGIIKERLTRGYKNCELQQPFTQIGDYVSWLTSEHEYVVEQLSVELPTITAEDVRFFHTQIMSQLHIEAYVHGNLYKEDALKLTDMIESILKPRVLPKEEWPIMRSLTFPPGSSYLYKKTLRDPANVNHCLEYYLHIGDKGDRSIRAKTQLLDQIIHEPAFDQLRTKEQLGYIVFSGLRGSATTYGFRFIIQSERTSEYLESRIDSFLQAQATAIQEMTEASFESHKRSVVVKRLEKLKNLDQETGRHWAQISNEYYDFEAAQQDAAQVEKLTKAEMIDFYKTFIDPTSPTRAKLIVQLIARGTSSKAKEADAKEEEVAPSISNGTKPLLITSNPADIHSRCFSTIRLPADLFISGIGSRCISVSVSETNCTNTNANTAQATIIGTCHACAVGDPGDLISSFSLELPGQLTAKTSSLKKRKITPRPSTARDQEIDALDSPDIPVQSCEQDSDINLSFTSSSFGVLPASPAYVRADSLPPASSLPPRLQTNHAGLPGPPRRRLVRRELALWCLRRPHHPQGASPFTKTTHHRAIMGGAAEFPERASSPLKRRASSMEPEREPEGEPESTTQDADIDVDMVTIPASDATGINSTTSLHQSSSNTTDFVEPVDISQNTQPVAANNSVTTTPNATLSLESPILIEAHISKIRALVEEFNQTPCSDGQECYIVSRQWLTCVPLDSTRKQATSDLSSIPPVDNSDIIEEVIDDPCVGNGVTDIMKRKFVRLKASYGDMHFVPFPPAAWELLMQWPGLKDGQIPVRRVATDNSLHRDGTNVQIEYHPLVLTVHRLWSAHSQVPVDASLKATNPPPPRLARSSNMKFQAFLKQAKAMAKIDLTQRVRGWHVPNATDPYPTSTIGPAPPTPPNQLEITPNSDSRWDHLLIDVASFNELEKGSDRLMIDFGDLTNDPNNKSNKRTESSQTLRSLGIAKDQAIVLDPHEEGTEWTSNYMASDTTTLPTWTSPTTLTVQNHASRGGRTSPTSSGPFTRGRTKSGRTLGCVGLTNLGNTCYMNAALQCLRSVEELTRYFLIGEWERELNKANVLAHNGDVAAAYAHLLKEIHKDPPPSAFAPRQFKNTIGRHAPQFSGYGQQDSQEFLGFLLDGLQEDLSRVKKKPYIEKPDSTDEMIGDPAAIQKMANEVWEITRKRDDSVIADLFTGLYKSTLVCPVCDKVSITFDPFNNLTLQLPTANKWNHTVKFFPLNSKPIDIRVELDKHDNIKALKQFISTRVGIPVERLHGCEEWSKKFYKHYLDSMTASEEIASRDNAWIFELEAKPTNYPGTAPKTQKYRSLLDENAPVPASWDDEEAARLLVPVMHRKPASGKGYQARKWEGACVPHFIMVTPQEARSEEIIRRKVLEKVATFTKHTLFARLDESDASESTEPEMIGPNGSDTASSIGGRVIAQSEGSEDDIVDVRMKDVSDNKPSAGSRSTKPHIANRRPAWINPENFLPAQCQNLFEMGICTETSSPIPTGTESLSSEDQFDNATNGTASNDDSSSDEAPRQSTEMPLTRMNDESDDENGPPVTSFAHRPKSGRPAKGSAKPPNSRRKMKPRQQYGSKNSKKRLRQQQQRHQQEKQNAINFEDPANLSDPVPDGGPLIRLREGLVVDWSETAYEEIFGANGSLETWETCDTLPDPELERIQEARAKRRKHGLTLDECLDEFERDEVLSEQDMWYCPRCKEHRRASKKLDLWKTPDILIIHLKRFSSSGYRRDKLETLVEFPTENLDITSRVLQREEGKQEIYDLIGVDCHYGGLGGGHYTAYAKNFIDERWYSYNDSSVSQTTTERIVDSSAYMLFYRRRSSVPLGGASLNRILERCVNDDDEMSGLGEDRRLDEGFSQNGSSSALQGVGVSHLPENHGGISNMASTLHRPSSASFIGDARGVDDIRLLANSRFQSGQPIDEDEGIELEDTKVGAQPFASLTSWNFENLGNVSTAAGDSPFDSGAASDEAQHDSSSDERALSAQDDIDSNLPGMSEYKLSQPEEDSHSYLDRPTPEYAEQRLSSSTNQITHEVHEVIPNGDQDPQSDDATEIHLDDNDKIKVI